jgi:hypothetical protein
MFLMERAAQCLRTGLTAKSWWTGFRLVLSVFRFAYPAQYITPVYKTVNAQVLFNLQVAII